MIENNSEIKILDLLFSYIIMDLPIRIYLEEINPIEMKCWAQDHDHEEYRIFQIILIPTEWNARPMIRIPTA